MRLVPYTLIILLLLLAPGCRKDDEEKQPESFIIIPNDFLSATKYDQMIIEVQYVTGYKPTDVGTLNLKSFLEKRLNKPAGITIIQTEIASPGKTVYTFDEVKAIEKANRTQEAHDKTIAAYILFLNGDYSENSGSSKILGFAYGSSSMTIFEKTIKEFSGGIGKPSLSSLETTVLNHEFGHTLGLVNRGTPMQSQHLDAANDKHCANTKCLMYYSAETNHGVGGLMGGGIPALDSACIADLRGNGGK
jgi:hypothetical protein